MGAEPSFIMSKPAYGVTTAKGTRLSYIEGTFRLVATYSACN